MVRCTHEIPRQYFSFFQPIEILGRGMTGLVIKSYSLPQRTLCAVKIIPRHQNSRLQTELDILRSVSHPCIVKLLDLKSSEQYIFLKLELAEGGTLRSYIKGSSGFSEDRARIVMQRILEGLAHLHANGIIHRDIKPDNILLMKQHRFDAVKLADFSLSALADLDSTRKENCGTFIYMAPEVLLGKEYSHSVDIFATGMLLYQMLEGRHPFHVKGITNTYYIKLLTTVESPPPTRKCHCLSLYQRITRLDPSYRYTAAQALSHPWFNRDFRVIRAPLSHKEMKDCEQIQQQIVKEFWLVMLQNLDTKEDPQDQFYLSKLNRFSQKPKAENSETLPLTSKHLDELLGPYDYLARKQQKRHTWINESHPRIVQLNEIYGKIFVRKPHQSTYHPKVKEDKEDEVIGKQQIIAHHLQESMKQSILLEEKDKQTVPEVPRYSNEQKRHMKSIRRVVRTAQQEKIKLRAGSTFKNKKRKMMSNILRSTK